MQTVVIYESMYGNTHAIAERIAEAARKRGHATLVAVTHATPGSIDGADLVIVGGPTHVHGMTHAGTRHEAVEDAAEHGQLDPDAEGPGIREWFDAVQKVDGTWAAAFDTRLEGSPLLTGRASKGISRKLRHHGFSEMSEPESFLVDQDNHLLPGESDRAELWTLALMDSLPSK